MERVDLDAVQRDIEWYSGLNTEEATALAAELRVAREVVQAAPPPFLLRALADWLDLEDQRKGRTGDEAQHDLRALADALAAYDQHAAPSTPDPAGAP